jgi:hypothetical protein
MDRAALPASRALRAGAAARLCAGCRSASCNPYGWCHWKRHCEPRCYARFASGRRWRAILVDALRLATYSAAMPLPHGFVPPCLPTKAPQPPSGDTWVHEIKHDGFRMMVRRDAAGVRLLTARDE